MNGRRNALGGMNQTHFGYERNAKEKGDGQWKTKTGALMRKLI